MDKAQEVNPLEMPEHLQDRSLDNAPELIRVDPQHGYIKGNVVVVSRRAALFIEFFRAMQPDPDELRWFAAEIEGGVTLI